MSQRKDLRVIGWREWVRLPDLHIERVKAKVDTGARSSSLHAFDVEIHGSLNPQVSFCVHPLQNDTQHTVRCSALLIDQRWVKSSNGKRELRPVIRTQLDLAGDVWPIELTLTNRDAMGFRMLLGREAFRRRVWVDAGRSFLMPEHKPQARRARRRRRAP